MIQHKTANAFALMRFCSGVSFVTIFKCSHYYVSQCLEKTTRGRPVGELIADQGGLD